jgi:hypothetical protein
VSAACCGSGACRSFGFAARRKPVQLLLDGGFVDGVRVDVGATPLDRLGAALMLRVGYDFEIFRIAPTSSDEGIDLNHPIEKRFPKPQYNLKWL